MKSSIYNTRGIFWTYHNVFGLMNLPAIFQAIMNKLLRDLIDTRKIVSFTDDVIVEIKKEKENNELVEEVLKRMIYIWK